MPATPIRHFNLRKTALLIAGSLLVSLPVATPAAAQDEARMRKLEAEVKALQRKVFPGGSDQFFQPEIMAPEAQPVGPSATSGPVTDLLARMDAVESALQSLTAQVETNSNTMRLMNERVEQLEADAKAARDAGLLGNGAPEGAMGSNLSAMGATGASSGIPAGAPTGVTPGNFGTPAAAAAPAAGAATMVEKPEPSGDAAEDAYIYGYRLWDAGQYAAARTELEKVINLHPDHRRASWARNLIGRSWLDQGEAKRAGQAFVDNYVTNPAGERAPDSLLYLAKATLMLGDKSKSCEAIAELRAAYPAEATGRLMALTNETARQAGCN